jgi:hypothetical protein
MRDRGMSLKSACVVLGISRIGQYRKVSKRQSIDREQVIVEKLNLRL